MSKLTREQRDSDDICYYDVAPMIETFEACWGKGPLDVCVKLVSSDRIDVTVKLAGVKIASGAITAKDNKLCAGANIGLVKAKLCVTADFPNKTVWVKGKICTKDWSGWSCNGFKAKILSW